MSEELVERLRLWGKFAQFGDWADLLLAADAIEALQAQVERLTFDSIHTCHDDCPRLPCVQRREIEGLRAEIRHLTNELQAHRRKTRRSIR